MNAILSMKTRSLCLMAAAWMLGCFAVDGQAHAAGIGEDAQRGRAAIERHGCVACHRIPGIRSPGANVGPPLKRIATRGYIAGVLANTPANMIRWLRDPPAVDPRTAMPNLDLTDQESRDIAAYLYTLK
jgi:cytochrome c1